MVLLFFSCLNPQGEYQECSCGATEIETCFEILTTLVSLGWQLKGVKISASSGKATWLPVEAFDGQPIKRPIELLQQEWEEILLKSEGR